MRAGTVQVPALITAVVAAGAAAAALLLGGVMAFGVAASLADGTGDPEQRRHDRRLPIGVTVSGADRQVSQVHRPYGSVLQPAAVSRVAASAAVAKCRPRYGIPQESHTASMQGAFSW